jgi:hypothetical protein
MTKHELNKDITKLRKRYCLHRNRVAVNWKAAQWKSHQDEDNAIKAELKRLYFADSDFAHMNRKSILTLLRINVALRAIPLHQFGLFYNFK